jgi:hypothetical protein
MVTLVASKVFTHNCDSEKLSALIQCWNIVQKIERDGFQRCQTMLKFLAFQGAPYIFDISRLRVNSTYTKNLHCLCSVAETAYIFCPEVESRRKWWLNFGEGLVWNNERCGTAGNVFVSYWVLGSVRAWTDDMSGGDVSNAVTSRHIAKATHIVVLQNEPDSLLFVHRTVRRIGMSKGQQPQSFTRTDQVNIMRAFLLPAVKKKANSNRVFIIFNAISVYV